VIGWEVERAEVVPVGLHLRPLRHGEAHPHEDVLEALHRLGDQVEVPGTGTRRHRGEVEALSLEPEPAGDGLELRPLGREAGLEGVAHAVEGSADLAPPVGVEATDLGLERRQQRALAQELAIERAQLLEGRRGSDLRRRRRLDGGDLVEHRSLGHVG
jgi:hypothetical protein